MAILSDQKILEFSESKKLIVHPLLELAQIAGTKIDLRIDNSFHLIKRITMDSYDPAKFFGKNEAPAYLESHVVAYGESFVLHPGELVLAPTFESLRIPKDHVGILDGRSSLGRLGVLVHVTAASIDPGFTGPLIAELLNVGRVPVDLYPLMRIGALSLSKIEGKVSKIYGKKGKYSGLKNISNPGSGLFEDEEWNSILSFSQIGLEVIGTRREKVKP